MKNLRFTENNLQDLSISELTRFTQSLVSQNFFSKHKNILVTNCSREQDPKFHLMETLTIFIQVWQEGEAGRGTLYLFRNSKSKEQGVSSSHFLVMGEEFNTAELLDNAEKRDATAHNLIYNSNTARFTDCEKTKADCENLAIRLQETYDSIPSI